MNATFNTHLLKREALRLGFSHIGVARAGFMEQEAQRLEQWLHKGMHGQMSWMENHFDKRVDPRKLVDGAKSVVSLLFNYFPARIQSDPNAPKLSRYAYGEDYHFVLKRKLKSLIHTLRESVGDFHGRCFVDSAPILERDWARRSGVGWVGKNSLLINPRAGSWFFLAELVLDLEMLYDQPIRDYCGTCTRCIQACPTQAIDAQGYIVDGSKCISYLTIELKEAIPEAYQGKFENWMFGCDICQEVCPWNRFAAPHTEEAFLPHPELLDMTSQNWLELSEEVFQKVFRHSAVKRTKYAGLKRNIAFVLPAQ